MQGQHNIAPANVHDGTFSSRPVRVCADGDSPTETRQREVPARRSTSVLRLFRHRGVESGGSLQDGTRLSADAADLIARNGIMRCATNKNTNINFRCVDRSAEQLVYSLVSGRSRDKISPLSCRLMRRSVQYTIRRTLYVQIYTSRLPTQFTAVSSGRNVIHSAADGITTQRSQRLRGVTNGETSPAVRVNAGDQAIFSRKGMGGRMVRSPGNTIDLASSENGKSVLGGKTDAGRIGSAGQRGSDGIVRAPGFIDDKSQGGKAHPDSSVAKVRTSGKGAGADTGASGLQPGRRPGMVDEMPGRKDPIEKTGKPQIKPIKPDKGSEGKGGAGDEKIGFGTILDPLPFMIIRKNLEDKEEELEDADADEEEDNDLSRLSRRRSKHVVREGETVHSIAASWLGDARFARLIVIINRATINLTQIDGKDVPVLTPGQVIWLPSEYEREIHRRCYFPCVRAGRKSEPDINRSVEVESERKPLVGVPELNPPDMEIVGEGGHMDRGWGDKNQTDESQPDFNERQAGRTTDNHLEMVLYRIRHAGNRDSITIPVETERLVRYGLVGRVAGLYPPPVDRGFAGECQVEARMLVMQFSSYCRGIETKSAARADAFLSKLELSVDGAWKTIAVYESSGYSSVRHMFGASGSRESLVMDLPSEIVREMARQDFNRNWQEYCEHFVSELRRISRRQQDEPESIDEHEPGALP